MGVQPIWAGFGRHLVTNLTTVTTSVRQFTVLMLGRWLAQELVERGRTGEDQVLSLFLRFEQLSGYARHAVHGVDDDIRGIERVKRNLAETRRVTVQDDASGMILSDQKTYGIWGLYSVSARVSGLLDADTAGVTPLAADFLEVTARPKLRSVESELTRLLLKGGYIDAKVDSKIGAVAEVLAPDLSNMERDFYGRVLRDASEVREPTLEPAAQRQARFARMLRDQDSLDEPIGRVEMMALLDQARAIAPDLARPIERVLILEPMLAVADEVFRFAQSRSGQTISSLDSELADRWGRRPPNLDPSVFGDLHEEIAFHAGDENAAFALQVCDAFSQGEYGSAIETLTAWNGHVMQLRRGAAWIRIESGGRLDCHYRATERSLPTGDDLAAIWRNTYFIDSLKSVTRQVEQGP